MVPGFRVWGSGFYIACFVLGVWGSGSVSYFGFMFCDSSSVFRVSNFVLDVSCSGFQVSCVVFRVPGFGFRVSGIGFQISGFGFSGAPAPPAAAPLQTTKRPDGSNGTPPCVHAPRLCRCCFCCPGGRTSPERVTIPDAPVGAAVGAPAAAAAAAAAAEAAAAMPARENLH